MTSTQARNAYRQSEQMIDIHPVKLIHMMYERVLVHLDEAMVGVKEKNPLKRGENLGRAIAIVSELNASIRQDDKSESAQFLRGLYSAILVELPKVAVTNDIAILCQSRSYMQRLLEIWEETAMREHGLSVKGKGSSAGEAQKMESRVQRSLAAELAGTVPIPGKKNDKSTMSGLSFSV